MSARGCGRRDRPKQLRPTLLALRAVLRPERSGAGRRPFRRGRFAEVGPGRQARRRAAPPWLAAPGPVGRPGRAGPAPCWAGPAPRSRRHRHCTWRPPASWRDRHSARGRPRVKPMHRPRSAPSRTRRGRARADARTAARADACADARADPRPGPRLERPLHADRRVDASARNAARPSRPCPARAWPARAAKSVAIAKPKPCGDSSGSATSALSGRLRCAGTSPARRCMRGFSAVGRRAACATARARSRPAPRS